MFKWSALIVVAVALNGCAASQGFVSRDWANNMRELGIQPLFPPREDLRVGDIFIVEGNTAEDSSLQSGFSTLGIFFDHLMLDDELTAFYRNRPDFVSNSTSTPSAMSFQIRGASEQIKLRRVAFPGFLKATASGAEIAGLVPAQGLPIEFASNLSAAKSASLTVSGTESYALPMAKLLATVGGEQALMNEIRPKLQNSSLAPPRYVDVVIINEVYFARSFNVTIHSENAAAVAANITVLGVKSSQTVAAANSVTAATGASATTTSSPTVAATSGSAEPIPAKTAEELTADAQNQLREAQSKSGKDIPTLAGGKLTAGYNAMGNITLNQDYAAPIAIGYRGIRRRLQLLTSGTGTPVLTVTPAATLTPLSGTLPK